MFASVQKGIDRKSRILREVDQTVEEEGRRGELKSKDVSNYLFIMSLPSLVGPRD